MSPEQVTGDAKIDSRSDVYSLGIVFFEMVAGRKPYAAETPTKEMMAHVLEPVPNIQEIKKDLPDSVAAIARKALAKDPEERYQTAGAMAAEIDREVAGTTRPGIVPVRKTSATRLKVTLIGLAVVLAIAIIGVAALNLVRQGGDGSGSLDGTATSTALEQTEIAALLPDEEATPTKVPSPVPSETHTPRPSSTPSHTPTALPSPSETSVVAPAAATEAVAQVRVDASSINVRSGPGVNYPSTGFLSEDEIVRVVARTSQESWFLVELPSGGLGWVSATVVELINPERPEQIPTAATIPAPPPTDTPTPTPTPVPPTPRPRPQRTNTPTS